MFGIPTPESGASSSPVIKVPFGHNSLSPVFLHQGSPNDIVAITEVQITEAFDDLNATLSIGTSSNNEAILGQSEITPSLPYSFESGENYNFSLVENVSLFINPANSTQGAGLVLLTIV